MARSARREARRTSYTFGPFSSVAASVVGRDATRGGQQGAPAAEHATWRAAANGRYRTIYNSLDTIRARMAVTTAARSPAVSCWLAVAPAITSAAVIVLFTNPERDLAVGRIPVGGVQSRGWCRSTRSRSGRMKRRRPLLRREEAAASGARSDPFTSS